MIFVISNSKEFFYLKKKNPKSLFFCENITHYFKLKEYGCNYFFYKKIRYIDLINISKNWFKDKKNFDYFYFSGISISQMLTRKIIFDFKNNYRNFITIKKILTKKKKIIISSNCSNSLIKIASFFFKKNIKIINLEFFNQKVLPPSPNRASLKILKNHSIYNFLRFLQSFIGFYFKNKIIYLYEPMTFKSVKKIKNILISNSKFLFNGCYFKEKPQKNFTINEIELKKKIRLFEKKRIFNSLSVDKLFKFTFKDILIENKTNIESIINIYDDFLNFYKPKKIILNGETDIYSVIFSYLCNKKKISTFLLLDGNHFYKDDFLFFKNVHSDQPIFDYYFAQGNLNKKLLLKQGIDKNKIFNIRPPVVANLLSKNTAKKQQYDAIIVSYYISLINVQFPWDKQLEVESDIIFCLDKLGYKSVAIKLKPGLEFQDQKFFRNIENYKNIIFNKYNHKISIKIYLNFDKFSDVLLNSNLIIGPLSSAIVEAKFLNKKYIVYSPEECGITKEQLNNSSYFKKDDIALNLYNLKNKINKNKHSLNFKFNDLFSKNEISNLKNLFNV